MKNKDFNSLDWHDAVLKNIVIDRSNAGNNDTIEIIIVWQSGIESKLIFNDVYYASLSLNFGVIVEETILQAGIIDDSNIEIQGIKDKWQKYFDGINSIVGFEILTNSTASSIKIFALSFTLEDYISL